MPIRSSIWAKFDSKLTLTQLAHVRVLVGCSFSARLSKPVISMKGKVLQDFDKYGQIRNQFRLLPEIVATTSPGCLERYRQKYHCRLIDNLAIR
jgi:hypothetical protein